MVRDEIKHATRLERREHIPTSQRTPERDEAADWIEENAADEWQDWTLTNIANETRWSRPHITNVVEYYFRSPSEVTPHDIDGIDAADADEVQDLLGDVTGREVLIYRMGFRDGFRDAMDMQDGE